MPRWPELTRLTSELTERGHELAGEGLELVIGKRDEVDLVSDISQDLVNANRERSQLALSQVCSQRTKIRVRGHSCLRTCPKSHGPDPVLPPHLLALPSSLWQAQNPALPLPRTFIAINHTRPYFAP